MNGWRVENLGLINTVEFSKDNMRLRWTDGKWYSGTSSVQTPASDLPDARDMQMARRVGEHWLTEMES